MKKALLLVLILVLVTSCITFTACDPYNQEIKSAYQRVERKLINELRYDLPYDLQDVRINNIIFSDVNEEGNLRVDVYYAGAIPEGGIRNVRAIYELGAEYYNNLVVADNSGDVLKYLEALDACLTNMEYVDEDNTIYSNDLELDKNQMQQFNDTFLAKWGEDQVGFLPYFIDRTEINKIEEGNYTYEYIFIVRGFNFVKNPNGAFKLPSSAETILTLNAAKSQLDVYEQDIEISFKFDDNKFILVAERAFTHLNYRYLIGKDIAVSFNTVRTQKVDVTEKFIKMTMGQFDFKQPNQ